MTLCCLSSVLTLFICVQGATKSFVASQRPPRATRLVSAAKHRTDSGTFDRQLWPHPRMHLLACDVTDGVCIYRD